MDELKKRTTEVLLTTAIIVRTRANEDGGSPFVEQMSDRLLAAIESAFSADPDARPTNTVGYHWLGSAATNSGVCVRCGRWATDADRGAHRPHQLSHHAGPRRPTVMQGVGSRE